MLKEIITQSFSHGELAVPSACQTATGDGKLSEEVIHLDIGVLLGRSGRGRLRSHHREGDLWVYHG